MVITVDRARRSLIAADGTLWEVYSHAGTVESLVAAAGLKLSPYDEVYLDGRQVARDAPLPAPAVKRPRSTTHAGVPGRATIPSRCV